MNPEIIRLAALALIGAALGMLAMLPRVAQGEPTVRDHHEVPPFARSRTDIVQHGAGAEAP
jgi:hypothetical protein